MSCSFIHSHHGEYVDNVILLQTSIHGTQTLRYLQNFRERLYLFQTSIWLLFEEPDSLGYIIFMATLINTMQSEKIEIGQLRASIALNANFCIETWPSLSPSERSGALGMLQADSARYNVARTLEVAHSAVSKLMADAGWPYLTATVLDHDV